MHDIGIVSNVQSNLKKVAYVDDERLRVGLDRDPFGVFHQMQSSNLILMKNSEKIAVRVGHQAMDLCG